MSKRAVIYARTSYDDRDNDDINIDSQLSMGREYCQRNGYSIVFELHEDDRGASGAELNLPVLRKIIEMARAGYFDVLVVRDLIRLSRDVVKLRIVKKELEQNGVSVEYVKYAFSKTPNGRLMETVWAALGENERAEIAWRMMNGKRNWVNRSHVVLNTAPYGYRKIREDVRGKPGHIKLEVYNPEANIVTQIYTWYANESLPIREIVRRLDGMNIPQPITNGRKRSAGWPRSTIFNILHSPTYKGEWEYTFDGKAIFEEGTMNYKAEVPAIIDNQLWEAVQAIARDNKERSQRARKYEYLFGRRLTCGVCGHYMACEPQWTRDHLYLYYVCPGPANDRRGGCKGMRVRVDLIDSLSWDYITDMLKDPEKLRAEIDIYQSRAEIENAPSMRQLGIVNDLISENRAKLKKLIDLYVNNIYSMVDLQERKISLEAEINGLESRKVELESSLSGKIYSQEEIDELCYAADIGERLDDATHEQKLQLFNLEGMRGTLIDKDHFQLWCKLRPIPQTIMINNLEMQPFGPGTPTLRRSPG